MRTRFDLVAVAALVGAAAGCNLILGTEPPVPLGTGGGALGDAGGAVPCGDAEWTHWDPTATHTYDTRQGSDGKSYVTDGLTRLAWQTPAPADQSAVTWEAASAYCKGLAWGGLQDYRLPTLVELASLTRYDLPAPSLDPAAFPDASGGDFWTGTLATQFSDSAYLISHGNGQVGSRKKIATAGVRCVHDLKPAADTGCARYALVDGEDAVRDIETGLVWQRVQSSGMKNWGDAKAACTALKLAGQTWRLPEISERITLLDIRGTSPSGLAPPFDAGEPGDFYWTATPDIAAPKTQAWNVDALTFVAAPGLSSQEFYVRCVR